MHACMQHWCQTDKDKCGRQAAQDKASSRRSSRLAGASNSTFLGEGDNNKGCFRIQRYVHLHLHRVQLLGKSGTCLRSIDSKLHLGPDD